MKMYNIMQAKEIPNREKPVWLRIGKAFEKEDGKLRMKLDVLPLPNNDGDVWLNLFEDDGGRKDEGFKPSGYDAPGGDTQPASGFDDDIRF